MKQRKKIRDLERRVVRAELRAARSEQRIAALEETAAEKAASLHEVIKIAFELSGRAARAEQLYENAVHFITTAPMEAEEA